MATSDANTPIKVELLPLKIAQESMIVDYESEKLAEFPFHMKQERLCVSPISP